MSVALHCCAFSRKRHSNGWAPKKRYPLM
jgi:hypothetical protein